jgi:hypothetical protein
MKSETDRLHRQFSVNSCLVYCLQSTTFLMQPLILEFDYRLRNFLGQRILLILHFSGVLVGRSFNGNRTSHLHGDFYTLLCYSHSVFKSKSSKESSVHRDIKASREVPSETGELSKAAIKQD